MVFIEPSYKILTKISEGGFNEIKLIEKCARYSYRSEDKITEDGESAKKLISMLIKNGHESCLEHSILTVLFTCDRATANELVRHRLASFTQESTRYVNVTAEKLGTNGEMQVILPKELEKGKKIYNEQALIMCRDTKRPYYNSDCVLTYACEKLSNGNISKDDFDELRKYVYFDDAACASEVYYNTLLKSNLSLDITRSVLLHSLATKIVMTANYREWRHVFNLRCDSHAHPEMRRIMIPLLHEVQEKIPIVFDDIKF